MWGYYKQCCSEHSYVTLLVTHAHTSVCVELSAIAGCMGMEPFFPSRFSSIQSK